MGLAVLGLAVLGRPVGRWRAGSLGRIARSVRVLVGGLATHAMGVHAIWLASVCLAVTLVLFIADGRTNRTENA